MCSDFTGQLAATIFDSNPRSHIMITHCGLHHGSLVHLWTAVATRSRALTPKLRLKLTTTLIHHGFDPVQSKVISWNTC